MQDQLLRGRSPGHLNTAPEPIQSARTFLFHISYLCLPDVFSFIFHTSVIFVCLRSAVTVRIFLYFPYFGLLSQCSFRCTSLHSVHGGDLNRRTCKKRKKGYYFRALLFMFFGESPSGLRSRIFHLLCMNTCFSVHSPIWVFESVCRRRLVCRVNVV